MLNLEQQIEGVNKINALTIKSLNHILPQLQKYVGKKILITTEFSKNFNIDHLEIENTFVRSYISRSYGNLILNIDTTIKVGEFSCEYFKNTIYLGTINEGVLQSLETIGNLISKYELDRVYEYGFVKIAQEQIYSYEKRISNLKKDLSKFNLK
jgi:hypothetical protein